MVTAEHSLVHDPLIGVRMGDGAGMRMGLRELFLRAEQIADLDIPVPPAASGMWRILYVLAARITGLDTCPDDLASWHAQRRQVLKRGRFDEKDVDRYLRAWGERLCLRGTRPFLQDHRLATECASSSGLNKLVFPRPSGNNHAWWQHTRDEQSAPIGPVEALWWMLAQLYYGASGQCTPRTVDGRRFGNAYAGPLRSAVSFHPVGRTLFESLVLGIPAPSDEDDNEDAWWETEIPDPLDPSGQQMRGTGSLLTGRFSHAVLLVWADDGAHVTDAYLTWGRRAPVEAVDPYVIRNFSQQHTAYNRPASADRALWRDLDALLLEGSDGTQPPRVFQSLDGVQAEYRTALRVRAFGFDQDGQATDRQYFTAISPPSFKLVEPEAAQRVRACRVAAENVARRLGFAARTAWFESASSLAAPPDKTRSGPWAGRALRAYWPEAEKIFWDHFSGPGSGPRAVRPFVALAVRVLEEAAGPAACTPAGAKALNHAKALLWKLSSDTATDANGA